MSEHTHRLVADEHYHRTERLTEGDVLTPTEGELEAFPHKFEELAASSSADGDGSASEGAGDPDGSETGSDATNGGADTEPSGSGSDTPDGDDAAEPPVDPSDLTVDALEERLEAGDYSEDELDAIEAAEESRSGGARTTALEAINEERNDDHA